MVISRQKKEEVVKKITDAVRNSVSVVFVNFHGLKVADANALRRRFRENGVKYTVAKKTLVKRAFSNAKITGEMPALDGELALAYSDDAIAPAKIVAEFKKKYENRVSPLGGIFENRYISVEDVLSLSKIPSRDILYGQFVTVLNAPIQQTVTVLNAATQSFVRALHQIAQKKA